MNIMPSSVPKSRAKNRGNSRPAARPATAPKPAVDTGALPTNALTTDVLFEVLADGTRRRLLVQLLDEREMCVNSMVEALQQSQPTISRHLAALRGAGVLVVRREWRRKLYRYHPDLPGWAMQAIAMLSEGAKLEPGYQIDASRLASAKRRDDIVFP